MLSVRYFVVPIQAAQAVLIALLDLNAPQLEAMIAVLPKTFQVYLSTDVR